MSEAICLVGWGAISQRVAALLTSRRSQIRIAAVAVRDISKTREALPEGARLISRPDELASTGAALVIEAAGRQSVLPFGRAAFSAGMDFAVSSTSAFVENSSLTELITLARDNSRQLILPPGALGGVDALSAASRLGIDRVEHRIVKPANAWFGTEAETLCELKALSGPFAFFQGNAQEAADRFPQNANATIITSIAGIGLEKTSISLVADPTAVLNKHEIYAEGDFGVLEIRIQNRPLVMNPKTSEMTALNIVRLIENRLSGVVI